MIKTLQQLLVARLQNNVEDCVRIHASLIAQLKRRGFHEPHLAVDLRELCIISDSTSALRNV